MQVRGGRQRVRRGGGAGTGPREPAPAEPAEPAEPAGASGAAVSTDSADPPACRWVFGVRRNQYASTGTMVSDTSSDATSAIVTVSAKGRKSSPTSSATNATGRKTATVVRVEAVTAPATSRTASRTARVRSTPGCRCRLMFSMTTIESSTTRPIAIVSAARVMTFSV